MSNTNTVTLSGDDTVIINDRPLTDFAEGDVAHLTFPNDMAAVKTGKNGNTIYAFNATGQNCEMDLRIMRGSRDDKFLNQLLNLQNANFAGFTLMTGEFIKQLGDGKGTIQQDISITRGGVFKTQPEVKSNVEGDTEQSVVIYKLKFAAGTRVIT